MLTLTKKKDQAVVINDNIRVVVVKILGDKVRLGFEAPDGITICSEKCNIKKQTQKDVGLRGKDLLVEAINHIAIYPESWDQHKYFVSREHSSEPVDFASWCVKTGNAYDIDKTFYSADCLANITGVSNEEAIWLLDHDRTIFELHRFVRMFVNDIETEHCRGRCDASRFVVSILKVPQGQVEDHE